MPHFCFQTKKKKKKDEDGASPPPYPVHTFLLFPFHPPPPISIFNPIRILHYRAMILLVVDIPSDLMSSFQNVVDRVKSQRSYTN